MVAGLSASIGCSAHEGGIDSPGGAGGEADSAAEAGDPAGSDLGDDASAIEEAAVDASLGRAEAGSVQENDAAVRASCVYHTVPTVEMDASVPEPLESSVPAAAEAGADSSDASAGGGRSGDSGATAEGGRAIRDGGAEAGPPTDVSVEMSGFNYLADISGRALYIYAADVPGDCQQAPVSTCEADCLISWPIFDAKKRRLAPGLKDELFGSIKRADGTDQTTYRGWPLYYFKTDTARGMVTGQGKSKVWFLATVLAPDVTIMKTGPEKRLADFTGRTLYAHAADVKGTEDTDPASACTGPCIDAHPPVLQNRISVVASLEPSDFRLFLRNGTTRMQLAYKGAPLYYSTSDQRLGEVSGVGDGWSIVVP